MPNIKRYLHLWCQDPLFGGSIFSTTQLGPLINHKYYYEKTILNKQNSSFNCVFNHSCILRRTCD